MKRLLIVCLATSAFASFAADAPSINISLGIRDNTFVTLQKVEYPLAFQIENTGKTVIQKHDIPSLFFKGTVHLLPKGGEEQKTRVQEAWRTMIYDLQPGAIFESPVYGDLFTFFPFTKDGVYEVWWTLGDFKSNVLRFTVIDGKVARDDPKT